MRTKHSHVAPPSARYLLVALIAVAATSLAPAAQTQATLTITAYDLISQSKQSKSGFVDFVYAARVTNHGAAISGATARAAIVSNKLTLGDAEVTFGAVAAGGIGSSVDTFTVRKHGPQPPDLADLRWTFTATPAVNHPPVANAGLDQTIAIGGTAILNGTGSTDPDGDPLTYAWSVASRPAASRATLSNATTVNPTFTLDVPGSYQLRLIVSDGTRSSTPATVTVSTINSAPVANAGADQTAPLGTPVRLDGTGSSDVDGDALTFAWSIVGRPGGSNAVLSDPAAPNPTFVVDVGGTFMLALVVNDGAMNSVADTMLVTTVNSAPVANAGADQSVFVGTTATLYGAGSTDVDGDLLTYAWALTSAPAGSAAALSSSTAVSPTFVVDRPGTYVAQLIVNDGNMASVADTVVVTTQNSPPVPNAGADQTVRIGSLVLLDASASSDADGDTLAYQWSFTQRPAGSMATLTGSQSSGASFVADQPGTYIVQMLAHDGMVWSAADTVTISTTNSAPTANAGGVLMGLPLNVPVTLDGSMSVDADGHSLQFAWSLITRPQGSAAVLTGETTAWPSFTPDVAGDYVAQLIVNDGYVDSAPVTVMVRASAPPVVTVTAVTASVAEAGPAALFTISRAGDTSADLAVSFTMGGSATPGVDYELPSASAVIPAGAVSTTVSIAPVDDATGEGDEDVVLTLVPGVGYELGTPGSAAVTIVDDDSTVTVTATDGSAAESGPDTATFAFTRSGATENPLVVFVALSGSATPPASSSTAASGDYSFTVGGLATFVSANGLFPVSFAAGQASAAVVVTPRLDAPDGGAETVVLTVDGTTFSAMATIADADMSIAAVDASAAEAGADPATFTITRNGATATALAVPLTLSGTATPPTGSSDSTDGDYTLTVNGFPVALTNATLVATIPAGQRTATIVVTPRLDPPDRGPESVTLTLNAMAATATATIADADITIAAIDATAHESGPDTATFVISRSGSTTGLLVLPVTISGTATAPAVTSTSPGGDYTFMAGGGAVSVVGGTFSASIPAGQTSTTIVVTPRLDGPDGGAETVTLTIGATGATASAAITDADIIVVATDPAAHESGPDSATFVVTRNGPAAAALPVPVTLSGTAAAPAGSSTAGGGDYSFTLNGSAVSVTGGVFTIPFAAGQTSATLVVSPRLDASDGGDETVVLTVNATGAAATATIADANITVTATDPTASEVGPDTAAFVITRNGSTVSSLVVPVTLSGTAAVPGSSSASTTGDYTFTVGGSNVAITGGVFNATIAAGKTSVTVLVTPRLDPPDGAQETVVLTVNATGAADTATIADAPAP